MKGCVVFCDVLDPVVAGVSGTACMSPLAPATVDAATVVGASARSRIAALAAWPRRLLHVYKLKVSSNMWSSRFARLVLALVLNLLVVASFEATPSLLAVSLTGNGTVQTPEAHSEGYVSTLPWAHHTLLALGVVLVVMGATHAWLYWRIYYTVVRNER